MGGFFWQWIKHLMQNSGKSVDKLVKPS